MGGSWGLKPADSFELDPASFSAEGVRIAVHARSGAGKSNLAALIAEKALEAGHSTRCASKSP